jgi:manganese oxidase
MLILFFALLMAAAPARAGQTRTYYIAVDEVDWDYAPSHADQINGEKYHFQDLPASKGMLNPNATSYRKALFRELDVSLPYAGPFQGRDENLVQSRALNCSEYE